MNQDEYFRFLLTRGNFDAESFDSMVVMGVKFSGCNLELTSFYAGQFKSCEFDTCDFYHSVLTEAAFDACIFNQVDFSGANLDFSIFKNSIIRNCVFGLNSFGRPASMLGADFSTTEFEDCKFVKTKINKDTLFSKNFNVASFDFLRGE